jgi:hypothetical protein
MIAELNTVNILAFPTLPQDQMAFQTRLPLCCSHSSMSV